MLVQMCRPVKLPDHEPSSVLDTTFSMTLPDAPALWLEAASVGRAAPMAVSSDLPTVVGWLPVQVMADKSVRLDMSLCDRFQSLPARPEAFDAAKAKKTHSVTASSCPCSGRDISFTTLISSTTPNAVDALKGTRITVEDLRLYISHFQRSTMAVEYFQHPTTPGVNKLPRNKTTLADFIREDASDLLRRGLVLSVEYFKIPQNGCGQCIVKRAAAAPASPSMGRSMPPSPMPLSSPSQQHQSLSSPLSQHVSLMALSGSLPLSTALVAAPLSPISGGPPRATPLTAGGVATMLRAASPALTLQRGVTAMSPSPLGRVFSPVSPLSTVARPQPLNGSLSASSSLSLLPHSPCLSGGRALATDATLPLLSTASTSRSWRGSVGVVPFSLGPQAVMPLGLASHSSMPTTMAPSPSHPESHWPSATLPGADGTLSVSPSASAFAPQGRGMGIVPLSLGRQAGMTPPVPAARTAMIWTTHCSASELRAAPAADGALPSTPTAHGQPPDTATTANMADTEPLRRGGEPRKRVAPAPRNTSKRAAVEVSFGL